LLFFFCQFHFFASCLLPAAALTFNIAWDEEWTALLQKSTFFCFAGSSTADWPIHGPTTAQGCACFSTTCDLHASIRAPLILRRETSGRTQQGINTPCHHKLSNMQHVLSTVRYLNGYTRNIIHHNSQCTCCSHSSTNISTIRTCSSDTHPMVAHFLPVAAGLVQHA
jgi:hypothetical protein